jgi:hypothetical protein
MDARKGGLTQIIRRMNPCLYWLWLCRWAKDERTKNLKKISSQLLTLKVLSIPPTWGLTTPPAGLSPFIFLAPSTTAQDPPPQAGRMGVVKNFPVRAPRGTPCPAAVLVGAS